MPYPDPDGGLPPAENTIPQSWKDAYNAVSWRNEREVEREKLGGQTWRVWRLDQDLEDGHELTFHYQEISLS